MGEYVIVSDATLDLPIDVIRQYDLRIIPMGVDIDHIAYSYHPDEREIAIDDFYNRLKAGSVSHTTQITPAAFMEFFTEILSQGKDILYIAFSSGLSGTYAASLLVMDTLAREFPDRKIYCVDSLCASIGEGLLVYNAALKKEQGMDIDELKGWVENNRTYLRHWFTVKDLFYLKRGGRVSSIEAVVGTALKIRPVLSVDENGKLVVLSKIRGSKAELDLMITKLLKEGVDLASQTIMIGHGDNLEQAKELERQIRDKGIVKDVIISKVGPIIGTHTGPGMLAMVYMGVKTE